MPVNMSFPFAAIPPERGAMKPILIGPFPWAKRTEGLRTMKLNVIATEKNTKNPFFMMLFLLSCSLFESNPALFSSLPT